RSLLREGLEGDRRRLPPAGAGADLQDDVLLVVRVARQQELAQLGEQRLALRLEGAQVLESHGAQIGVLPERPGVADLLLDLLEFAVAPDDALEIGVRL